MNATVKQRKNSTRRPLPWGLYRHWAWRYALAWLLLAALIFIVLTVLSAVLHDRKDVVNFLRVMNRMPKIFKAFIGGDELMPSNLLAIVGIGYQHPTVLTALMINAVVVTTGLLTAQAEQGTMELLLARPVTRTRIYGGAAGLALISQTALVWLVFAATAIWTRVFDYGEQIALEPFARAALNLNALAVAVVGLSLFVAALMNERGKAVGIIIAYLVGSYLLDFSSVWLPRLKAFHPVSLFYYCRINRVLDSPELPWTNLAVLGGICVASTLAGWLVWRHKDLAVA